MSLERAAEAFSGEWPTNQEQLLLYRLAQLLWPLDAEKTVCVRIVDRMIKFRSIPRTVYQNIRDIKVCTDFKILEVKVLIKFPGTWGFPLHRDGR